MTGAHVGVVPKQVTTRESPCCREKGPLICLLQALIASWSLEALSQEDIFCQPRGVDAWMPGGFVGSAAKTGAGESTV